MLPSAGDVGGVNREEMHVVQGYSGVSDNEFITIYECIYRQILSLASHSVVLTRQFSAVLTSCALYSSSTTFVTFALIHYLWLSWRVENSHSVSRGNKGYIIMTDEWFDEFLYQVDSLIRSLRELTHSVLNRALIYSCTHSRGGCSLTALLTH